MEVKDNNAQRIELSLSSNYLAHWTVYDALREVFQNAFDRAKEDSEAKWFYSESVQSMNKLSLTIGNNNTQLSKRSLLLGETTKYNSKSAIGKFGEGYKLAMLVFLRNGIKPSIRTQNEVWEFALEYNETFQATMLVVYITEVKDTIEDLIFTFCGIKRSTFNSYSQYNLLLQSNLDFIATDKGDLLLDKRNRGKIFVGNLYVCEYKGDAMYGYNFRPGTFELGRDRRTISGIDLTWETSKAILEGTKKSIEVAANVAESIATDKIKKTEGEYVHNFMSGFNELKSNIWKLFQKKNPNSLPISSQEDHDKVVASHAKAPSTAYVSYSLKEILTDTEEYKELEESLEKVEVKEKQSPYDILIDFSNTYIFATNYICDERMEEAFNKVLVQAEEWIWK